MIQCPIHTICFGEAASFAVLLFASGDVRKMYPLAKIMIHDPLISGNGLTGSATLMQIFIIFKMKIYLIYLINLLMRLKIGKTVKKESKDYRRNRRVFASVVLKFWKSLGNINQNWILVCLKKRFHRKISPKQQE